MIFIYMLGDKSIEYRSNRTNEYWDIKQAF